MSHPWYHAENRARQWGGAPADYLPCEQWFDQSKAFTPDARHRLLLHQSLGIFIAEQRFGPVIVNSAGRAVPTRLVGESHVKEDFGGMIPSLHQCFADGLSLRQETPALETLRQAYLHAGTQQRGTYSADADLHAFLDAPADHVPGGAGLLATHHTFGVVLAVQVFGPRLPSGRVTRTVAEDHIQAALGSVPATDAALQLIPLQAWMSTRALPLKRLVEANPAPVRS